ncbi:hypothetical protein [Mucilaginibacter pedocola]|nr:hypothetical protein [Mucilaginibacter pedocola]
MLQQITWTAYAATVIILTIIYYLCILPAFYREDIKRAVHKFTGRKQALAVAGDTDLLLPEGEIMGRALPEAAAIVAPEELSFAPPDEAEAIRDPASIVLESDHAEMAFEVETLIKVIRGSDESKEDFGMLFRLIIQKYPSVAGTAYQQVIDQLLLNESASGFPFELNEQEIKNYWQEEVQ